jgi:lipopolysaccharide transport system permease protein
MQIAFFMTPVIWKPEQLGSRQALLWLNPFFDLLEIVRAPLLGAVPIVHHLWLGASVFSVVLWGLAWFLFTRARGRIAFWL